jgi:hypothetical protein
VRFQPHVGVPLALTAGTQAIPLFAQIKELYETPRVRFTERPKLVIIGREKLKFRFCKFTVPIPRDCDDPKGGRPWTGGVWAHDEAPKNRNAITATVRFIASPIRLESCCLSDLY